MSGASTQNNILYYLWLECKCNNTDLQRQKISENQKPARQKMVTQSQPIFIESEVSNQGKELEVVRKRSNSQNFNKNGEKWSCFHNFQKHLIVTLRKTIKINISNIRCQDNIDKQVANLTQQIWSKFLNSTSISKKSLYSIFNYPFNDSQTDDQLSRKNKDNWLQAQRVLKEEIIRQGQIIVSSGELRRRKIKRKQSFEEYFKFFLEELREGKMERRLPKTLRRKHIFQTKIIEKQRS